MRRLMVLAFLTTCFFAAFSCSTVRDIRVENVSPHDFADVRIGDQEFGDVPAGATSEYRAVTLTFKYAAMEMTIDGRRITGQSLNVGSDRFTHRIDVKDLAERHLRIDVVRDPGRVR